MRRFPRTLVVRCFAALLLCLTASPVTAPFTTCDLSDFMQHHSSDAPRPGHQVAVPGKVTPSVDAPAMSARPSAILFALALGCPTTRFTTLPSGSIRLPTVLRI